MAWLIQQPGIELTADVIATAAERGDRAMCELLHANQCPWDEECCFSAAHAGITEHGNLDMLRWFRQHGCPWDSGLIATDAAYNDSVELLEYLQHEGVVFSANKLQQLLNVAGAFNSLTTAKWLRQQGADWPAVLQAYGGYFEDDEWSGNVLTWARSEGCDSPLEHQYYE
jgi:hypothetical protein